MKKEQKQKINKYMNVSYIGLLFIFISMSIDYARGPGEIYFFLIGFLLMFVGLGLASINYYRWK